MKRLICRVFIAGTLGCAVLLGAASAHAEEVLGANLKGLLSFAREHNPELRGRTQEADAAYERIEPASAMPDPRFQIELMDFTNTMSDGGTSLVPGDVGQTRYRIIQPLPFWGKRDLRGEVASSFAEQSRSLVSSTVLALEARIKTAYARYFQAGGQAEILRETLSLVEALGRLVETRYSVGLVPQQDVVRAHSEITSLKVELVEIERRRRDAAARLNTQLPRRADAPLAAPAYLPPLPVSLSLSKLYEQAKNNSPELLREQLGIEGATKSRDLTLLNRYPDFSVGLTNNRPKNNQDNWDLMLELSIPLQQSSRRAQEREAEHRISAARSRLSAAEAKLNGRIGEVLASLEANREKSRLLKDTLLPQSDANLKAAQAGYESARVNFNTLIEAERQILKTRLALLEAEVEASVQLAELEQLVGTPL